MMNVRKSLDTAAPAGRPQPEGRAARHFRRLQGPCGERRGFPAGGALPTLYGAIYRNVLSHVPSTEVHEVEASKGDLLSLGDRGYHSNRVARQGSPHGWRDSLMFAGLISHWFASKSSVRSYVLSQNFSALYQSVGSSNRTRPRFQALA
jgi:hypothetical protein